MYFRCPHVSISTTGIESFPLCQLQCEQAENFCGATFSCDSFPNRNCMISLPEGYFLLDSQQGPYHPLVIVYGISLPVWLLIVGCWHTGSIIREVESTIFVIRAMFMLPLMKLSFVLIAIVFWSHCESEMMCNLSVGILLVAIHLIFETVVAICFLLIAKGWRLTRQSFSIIEKRRVIFAICFFVVLITIILVLDSMVLTKQGFWIACGVAYGSMYLYIISCACRELYKMRCLMNRILRSAAGEVPAAIKSPLHQKYCKYESFLILVLCKVAMEIVLHFLMHKYGRLWIVLFVDEINDLVVCGLFLYTFRPECYSPFFFLTFADTENPLTENGIPIIEVNHDALDPVEIEMTPLMEPSANEEHIDTVIVVRNPDGLVTIGTSITKS